MDSNISFQLEVGAGSTAYFPTPYRCVVRDATACAQGDPADGDEITLSNLGDDLGVATFGAGLSTGGVSTWGEDATNGNKVLEKGDIISIVNGGAADCIIDLELDPYARKAKDYNV